MTPFQTKLLLGANAVILALAVGVTVWNVYRNRTPAATPASVSAAPDVVLKAPTGDLAGSMQVYVNENSLVVSFEVVDVDLTRNIRQVVWFYSDNDNLTRLYRDYEAKKVGATPWLAGDKVVIDRNLSIINGAYSCIPITDTPLPRIIPGMDTYVKHVCVVAVPPDYGKFSGYLAAWLTREPTPEEIHRLVERMRSFSSRVF